MTQPNEAQTDAAVAGHYALLAAEPHTVRVDSPEALHIHSKADGTGVVVTDIAAALEKYQDGPYRKRGVFAVHDGPSLVKYLEKHAYADTEVWADVLSTSITGVLNAHPGVPAHEGLAEAGWADHRVLYTVEPTDAWKAWAQADGQLMDQVAFAELIEDRAVDIISPAAADMLEIVQTFTATTDIEFESGTRLTSGEARLVYKETVNAQAKNGQLEIPQTFTLRLKPFEGAEPHDLTARLRFRIQHKQLRIGFKLDRPADLLRDAFEDVIRDVESQITWPVFRGKSA